MAGFVTLETLSGWGARYPEKKARRLGQGILNLTELGVLVCDGSRIFRERQIVDFAVGF